MKKFTIFIILLFFVIFSQAGEYPFVGHFQGYCLGIAKYSDYFYFNAGGNIIIARQDASNEIEVVNKFYCGTNYCYDVQVYDHYLVLALFGNGQGLAIYDISEPENPEYVSFAGGGYSPGYRRSMQMNDTILIAVGDNRSYFYNIVDVSQPLALSNIYFELNCADAVALSGNMYYGFSQDGYSGPHYLWGYDVSNPASPSQVAMLQIAPNYMAPFPDCMGGSDTELYVSFNDTIKIYDISNSTEIVYLSQFNASKSIRYFQIKDDLMVCALSGKGVEIYDISNIYQPVLVSFYEQPTAIDYIEFVDDYLLLALHNYGSAIADMSDVSNINESFHFEETDAVFGVKIESNLAYMGTYLDGYLVVNISDDLNPIKLSSIDTLRKIETIKTIPGYHFCRKLAGDDIYVVDVENVFDPFICSVISIGDGLSSYVIENDFLYARIGFDVITVYDVSVPEVPLFVDTLFIEGEQFDVQDSILVTYNSVYPNIFMTVYSLTQNFEPILLSQYQLGVSGAYSPRSIELVDRQIYICVGGGLVTAALDENSQFVKLDEMTWGNSSFYDMWFFLDEPNPFDYPTICISGAVQGVGYNFVFDVSDPSDIMLADTLPFSNTTLEPHGDIFYITRTYSGYDLYGDYLVSIRDMETQQNVEDKLSIYPNPCSIKTTIQVLSSVDEMSTVRIFSSNGEQIFKTQSKIKIQFDASGLSPGIYIVQVEGKGFSSSQKMIVK